MKKTGLFFALAAVLLACGASHDEAGFEQVAEWSDAAISQAEQTIADIADSGTADYEPLDELVDQADLELPDDIDTWRVVEHRIEGEELDAAVAEMTSAMDRVAADLDMDAGEDQMIESVTRMHEASETLRAVFLND